MIGFEAEFDVPTFQKLSAGGMESGYEDIYSFLFGGYTDTSVATGANEFFKIKPDVADYATTGNELFLALSAFLKLNAFKKSVLITKLEYETPPVTETSPASDKTFSQQANLIMEHASQFARQAKDQIVEVPKPAVNMWAGVPVKEITEVINHGRQLLQKQAQDRAEMTATALEKMRAQVREEFAIQATAGIFPSVVPRLFEEPEKPLDQSSTKNGEAWKIAYPLIVSAIEQVLDQPAIKNHKSLQVLENNQVYREAFKGHLYLLFSYLVGDALSVSSLFENMSVKNAVPYHAKINLGYVYKAMPKGFQEPLPLALAQMIADVLTTQECTKPDFWLKQNLGLSGPRKDKERLVFNTHQDFVTLALTSQPVRTLLNQTGGPTPKEHVNPDGDPVSKDGEQGVQLEFRRLGMNEVPPDKLATKFLEVVNRVRKLNQPQLA
jgi:hypothetical protein